MVAWMAKIFSSARPPGVHHHRIFHKEQVPFFFFFLFFRDGRSRNVAYSATAEGNVRRMVSQKVKKIRWADDAGRNDDFDAHQREQEREGNLSWTLHDFIVNALACKSSNRERGKMNVADRNRHVSKTIRRELFKNRYSWRWLDVSSIINHKYQLM